MPSTRPISPASPATCGQLSTYIRIHVGDSTGRSPCQNSLASSSRCTGAQPARPRGNVPESRRILPKPPHAIFRHYLTNLAVSGVGPGNEAALDLRDGPEAHAPMLPFMHIVLGSLRCQRSQALEPVPSPTESWHIDTKPAVCYTHHMQPESARGKTPATTSALPVSAR